MPFQIYIGGRGTGKTYSSLKQAITHDNFNRFMLWRRTEREAISIASPLANPFKKLNKDLNRNVIGEYSEKAGFGTFTEKVKDETVLHGYIGALSTFSGLRGVDFSDVDLLIGDEFIPERHKQKIKEEGIAFLNMYETINRNRELDGFPPVISYLFANAIMLNNPILLELGAVSIIQSMIRNVQSRYTDRKRGLYIERIEAGISEEKTRTALYNLTAGSRFEEQALHNRFTNDDLHLVRKVNLPEYIPSIMFGDMCIYTHKSNGTMYCAKKSEKCSIYFHEFERDKFRLAFAPRYRLALGAGIIFFDNYQTKLYLDSAVAK